MTGDYHVRIREGVGVKLPRATRLLNINLFLSAYLAPFLESTRKYWGEAFGIPNESTILQIAVPLGPAKTVFSDQ
jgi:hypothetical protein